MKWMSRPSIWVMKCGSDSNASHLNRLRSPVLDELHIVASCTPCVSPAAAGVDQIRREAASVTSSRSGHRVALMRRRSSSISPCRLTVNGRIELSSAAAAAKPR